MVALTYLALVLCAGAFGFGMWLDGRSATARYPRLARASLAFQLAALGGAYLVLRPGRGVDGDRAIAASMAHGQPLLLDVYSNW